MGDEYHVIGRFQTRSEYHEKPGQARAAVNNEEYTGWCEPEGDGAGR